MVMSMRNSINNAHNEYTTIERTIWVQQWPGQSILCVSKMFWTAEVHDIFIVQKPGQMRNYHKFLTVFSCKQSSVSAYLIFVYIIVLEPVG